MRILILLFLFNCLFFNCYEETYRTTELEIIKIDKAVIGEDEVVLGLIFLPLGLLEVIDTNFTIYFKNINNNYIIYKTSQDRECYVNMNILYFLFNDKKITKCKVKMMNNNVVSIINYK